jgi:hypothetical protein
MEVNGQLHDPAAIAPEKESLVPLDRRLSGPQNRSGHGGEEKNSQPLPGLEPPTIHSVAQRYTTELSRLIMLKILENETRTHHKNFRRTVHKAMKFRASREIEMWKPRTDLWRQV